MDARNATRNGLIIGLTAALVMAVVLAAVLFGDSGNEEDDYEVLQITSYAIESESYFPKYWINFTEDLRMYQRWVTFSIYNETGFRSLTTGPMSMTSAQVEDGFQFSGNLNLYYTEPGNYLAHLYVNATLPGFEAPEQHKRGHAVTNFTLTGERPPAPEIKSFVVEFNSTSGQWEYELNLVDPDADGDTMEVSLGEKGGYVVHFVRANNSLNETEWTFRNSIDVELTGDSYSLSAQVFDRDGPRTYTWTLIFYP